MHNDEASNHSMLLFIKQQDKQQHYAVCLLLTLVSLPYLGLIASTLLTFTVGLTKEIWDEYYGTGFCWYDMLANFMGWLSALCIYGLMTTC